MECFEKHYDCVWIGMADGVSKKFAVINSLRGDKKHIKCLFFKDWFFKNVYARMLCLPVCTWSGKVSSVCRGQKRYQMCWKLGVSMVVNCGVGTVKRTQVLCRNRTTSHLFSPRKFLGRATVCSLRELTETLSWTAFGSAPSQPGCF